MFKRVIATLLCVTFSFSNLQLSQAQDFSVNQLPLPGTMVGESAPFSPLALKGLVVNLQKPLEFQFIVDTGKGPQDTATIKDQANQLVKYFLAGLTIPEGDLWVNLSPYEKSRMVPAALGQTDLGRDLLAQDYILKQLTASLIYPEKDLGKAFWSRVYAKAQQQFGTTNVPVNTFNKVWILPDQAQVFENVNAAYVTKSTLKVMLDEDYLALHKHTTQNNGTDSIGSQIVREIVLPEITKEVNTGKNFAPLRQIYQALILAKWYKETIQNGLLDAIYTNKNKIAGVNLNDPAVKEQIYERYLKAYKKGAFNYIKEDPTPEGQVVPRKYFSGGAYFAGYYHLDKIHDSNAMISARKLVAGALLLLTFILGPAVNPVLAQNNISPQAFGGPVTQSPSVSPLEFSIPLPQGKITTYREAPPANTIQSNYKYIDQIPFGDGFHVQKGLTYAFSLEGKSFVDNKKIIKGKVLLVIEVVYKYEKGKSDKSYRIIVVPDDGGPRYLKIEETKTHKNVVLVDKAMSQALPKQTSYVAMNGQVLLPQESTTVHVGKWQDKEATPVVHIQYGGKEYTLIVWEVGKDELRGPYTPGLTIKDINDQLRQKKISAKIVYEPGGDLYVQNISTEQQNLILASPTRMAFLNDKFVQFNAAMTIKEEKMQKALAYIVWKKGRIKPQENSLLRRILSGEAAYSQLPDEIRDDPSFKRTFVCAKLIIESDGGLSDYSLGVIDIFLEGNIHRQVVLDELIRNGRILERAEHLLERAVQLMQNPDAEMKVEEYQRIADSLLYSEYTGSSPEKDQAKLLALRKLTKRVTEKIEEVKGTSVVSEEEINNVMQHLNAKTEEYSEGGKYTFKIRIDAAMLDGLKKIISRRKALIGIGAGAVIIKQGLSEIFLPYKGIAGKIVILPDSSHFDITKETEILIHGANENNIPKSFSGMAQEAVSRGKNFLVYAYDQNSSMDDWVGDLIKIVEKLKLMAKEQGADPENIAYIPYSMGADIFWYAVLKEPNLFTNVQVKQMAPAIGGAQEARVLPSVWLQERLVKFGVPFLASNGDIQLTRVLHPEGKVKIFEDLNVCNFLLNTVGVSNVQTFSPDVDTVVIATNSPLLGKVTKYPGVAHEKIAEDPRVIQAVFDQAMNANKISRRLFLKGAAGSLMAPMFPGFASSQDLSYESLSSMSDQELIAIIKDIADKNTTHFDVILSKTYLFASVVLQERYRQKPDARAGIRKGLIDVMDDKKNTYLTTGIMFHLLRQLTADEPNVLLDLYKRNLAGYDQEYLYLKQIFESPIFLRKNITEAEARVALNGLISSSRKIFASYKTAGIKFKSPLYKILRAEHYSSSIFFLVHRYVNFFIRQQDRMKLKADQMPGLKVTSASQIRQKLKDVFVNSQSVGVSAGIENANAGGYLNPGYLAHVQDLIEFYDILWHEYGHNDVDDQAPWLQESMDKNIRNGERLQNLQGIHELGGDIEAVVISMMEGAGEKAYLKFLSSLERSVADGEINEQFQIFDLLADEKPKEIVPEELYSKFINITNMEAHAFSRGFLSWLVSTSPGHGGILRDFTDWVLLYVSYNEVLDEFGKIPGGPVVGDDFFMKFKDRVVEKYKQKRSQRKTLPPKLGGIYPNIILNAQRFQMIDAAMTNKKSAGSNKTKSNKKALKASGQQKTFDPSRRTFLKKGGVWVTGGVLATAVFGGGGYWWWNRSSVPLTSTAEWPVNFHFIFNAHAGAIDNQQIADAWAKVTPGQPIIWFMEDIRDVNFLLSGVRESIRLLSPSDRQRFFAEMGWGAGTSVADAMEQLDKDERLFVNAKGEEILTSGYIRERINFYMRYFSLMKQQFVLNPFDPVTQENMPLVKAYPIYKPRIEIEGVSLEAAVEQLASEQFQKEAYNALLKEKNEEKYFYNMEKYLEADFRFNQLRDKNVVEQLQAIARNPQNKGTTIIVSRGDWHYITLRDDIETFRQKTNGVTLDLQSNPQQDTQKIRIRDFVELSHFRNGVYHTNDPIDKDQLKRILIEDILSRSFSASFTGSKFQLYKFPEKEGPSAYHQAIRVILSGLTGDTLDEFISSIQNNPFGPDADYFALAVYIIEQLRKFNRVTEDELQRLFLRVSLLDKGNLAEIDVEMPNGKIQKFGFPYKHTGGNRAMIENEKGGIDLNQINVLRGGRKVLVQFDPAQLNELEQSDFRGFTPVITGFQYISSPFPLLGINRPAKDSVLLAKA